MKLKSVTSLDVSGWSHLYASSAVYENRDGNKIKYDIVSRSKLNSEEDLKGKTDAVTIIVFAEGRRMLITEEFRLACCNLVTESPAGIIDAGETIEEAAVRECKEETGLTVKRVLGVLPAAYSSPGMTNEKVSVVFVEACYMEELPGSDSANEEIVGRWILVDNGPSLARNDRHASARTQLVLAAAPYFYDSYMKR